jgi:hypothetical protein
MDCLDQNWIEQVSTIAYTGSNAIDPRDRSGVFTGTKKMNAKMTIKNASDEMEESLYYSRVEPHIGHLQLR